MANRKIRKKIRRHTLPSNFPELKIVATRFLIEGKAFSVRRGRSARNERNPEKPPTALPGSILRYPTTTHEKSRMFHGSFQIMG